MEEYVCQVPPRLAEAFEEIDETFEKSNGVVGIKFPFHMHPLFPTENSSTASCVGCREARADLAGGYVCDRRRCRMFYVHKGCIEVTNPSHPAHPLSLMTIFTGSLLEPIKCSVCEAGYRYPFSGDTCVCRACARKEPYIDPKKSHEHRLFVLLKSFFSFPCEACGLTNDSSCLCLCVPCRFTIHRHCVNLPRVICINRHDHRISHVPRLGPRDCVCGVCRKKIDIRYGAYSCSTITCCFTSHSSCATRPDVWDGIDLEEVPEDDPEDIMPFKVVGEGLIKHFSHEHNLRLITEYDDKHKQCYACVLPIFSDPCYICMHCDFILHERCAEFPRKIRHMSHKNQLTLCSEIQPFRCQVCYKTCNGFAYIVDDDDFYIDLRCVSIYDGYVHKSQPDSILLAPDPDSPFNRCSSCGRVIINCVLSFDGHDNLFICYICATKPAQVIYRHDAHLLSLRFSENNATGDYWCEICEAKMDSRKWFYTCDECCTTVHIDCVLGTEPYLRVGSTFMSIFHETEMEVVRNNFATRPSCVMCSKFKTSRIVDPLVYKRRTFSIVLFTVANEFVLLVFL